MLREACELEVGVVDRALFRRWTFGVELDEFAVVLGKKVDTFDAAAIGAGAFVG